MNRNNKPGRIVKGTAKQPTLKDASGVWTLDEAMQAHRANAWPQPNLFQPIGNSLRIKQQSGSTTAGVLTKAITRDGDRRRHTMSMWVKLGTLAAAGGSIRTLWEGFTGTDNSYWLIYVTSGNQLYVGRDDNGGGTTATWAGVLRDPSAWYHIVIATDTGQSADANKVKVWINGVQQTLGGSYPSRGYPTAMGARDINNNSITNNFGAGIRIASRWNITYDQNIDGVYSEVNFVDGYQLPATLFGQFDTNNTWVPIPYTGSYGTTGFYLPFTNTQTSQTLGYDASATGSTVYDADRDPYRGNVVLHLTGNGPSYGQNNAFMDSSINNYPITRNGSATQGSFSPFPMPANVPYNPVVHGASAYFNGTSDWLATSQNANFTFDANFTIEFWVYISTNQNADLVGTANNAAYLGSGNSGWVIAYYTSGGIRFGYQASSAWSTDTTLGMTPTLNSWNHVAVVRSGSTITGYLNGVAGSTPITSSATFTSNLYGPYVGAGAGNQGLKLGGYISNLRIIKGAAVYTASFTPTNRPFGTKTNNLIAWSEDFSNASWTIDGTGATSAFNAGVAPDGTPSATLAREGTSASGGARTILTSPWSTLSGTTFTFSTYVKKYGQKRNIFMLAQESGNAFYAHFDIVAGIVVQASNSGTGTYTGSGITDVGNGWFRIWITGSITSSSIYTMITGEAVGATGFGSGNYTGDGTSGYLVWGAQLETASSPSNYTPTPANYSVTPTLLLNFANASIVDSAGVNNLVTGGTTTINSASKYGIGALAFDGTASYLTMPAPASAYFGTADFTIECWWKSNGNQGNYSTLIGQDFTGSPALGAWAFKVGSTSPQFTYGTGAGGLTNFDPSVTVNINDSTWHHYAVTRSNSTLRMFVDGRQVGAVSISASQVVGQSSTNVLIGYNPRDSVYISGTIDDLRITKGVARYVDTFAPPSRALPEAGGKSFVTTNINAGVVQRFTTVGTTSWTAPSDVTQVEVLVVAGGGGGGGEQETPAGGGGGAGGLIYNSTYSVNPGQTYTVTVGSGGPGGVGRAVGSSGGNSIFGNLVAIGGGGGGFYSGTPSLGGSGGGAGWRGALTSGGSGTAGQGFAGGTVSEVGSLQGAAGGGGAGGVGSNSSGRNGGTGGPGLLFGISGTPTYYAGGGGGGGGYGDSTPGTGAAGGSGVGGAGSNAVDGGAVGSNGVANSGSGGGGAGADNAPTYASRNGGNGAAGIVLIRYTTAAVGNTSDATTDNLVDSPTLYGHDYGNGGEVVGNYATFNPIYAQQATITLSNGNLTASNPSTWVRAMGTIAVNTGKWYFESYPADGVWHMTGVDQPVYSTTHIGGSSGTKGIALVYDPSDTRGDISYNGSNSAYTGGTTTFSAGDIIGVALDLDNNNVKFYKNGVLQYNLSNLLQSDAYYTFGVSLYSGGTISGNFGQRAWAYTPPQGFNALTTKNLPRLTNAAAIAPNQFFDVVTWTQGATDVTLTLPGAFQPDLVWIKSRSNAQNNYLVDSVRGPNSVLRSNTTDAESIYTPSVTFTSTGFTPSSTNTVTNTYTYVAWCWKAGNGTVTNTAGTITSSVSANTSSGFSIIGYTGTGSMSQTIGHGLGVAPSVVMFKNRTTGSTDWNTYAPSTSGFTRLKLNSTSGDFVSYPITVSSTTITLPAINDVAFSSTSNNYIVYAWAEVAGFSKFGAYTGNGSTDGPFVYCGFKPRWIMVKEATGTNAATGAWQIFDTARDLYNPSDNRLKANVTDAEAGSAPSWDVVSNGFKLRSTNSNWNESAGVYFYMAFAGSPFGNTNGTAR